MQKNHPGLLDDPNDPSLPLKIIRVYPPQVENASRNWSGEEGKYTVGLQLSRQVTTFEKRSINDKGAKEIRVYGSTLEISNTTLEEVNANKHEIAQVVSRAEAEGASAQQAYEAQQTQAEAARSAEAERRRKLADEITFD